MTHTVIFVCGGCGHLLPAEDVKLRKAHALASFYAALNDGECDHLGKGDGDDDCRST